MRKTLHEQYGESLMLLLHRIGDLKSERVRHRPNTAPWAELSSRIAALEVMLDDVYIQANGAREYVGLWGERGKVTSNH